MESIETVSRDSFVFYRSFFDAVEELDPEDRLAAFEAIIRYALDGTEGTQTGAVRAIMRVIKPLLDVSRQNYINGRMGGRPRKNRTETESKPNHNRTITEPKPNRNRTVTEPKPNVNVNVNYNVNDNVPVPDQAHTQAHTPTPEEVSQYAASIGYALDGQSFCDKYAAQGWRLSGEPVHDWKALVRRWKRQDEKPQAGRPNRFINFDQRVDDLDADMMAAVKRQQQEWREQHGAE